MTDGPERDEIYAYGLRNTWKFSFDSQTGDLWAGDVGQDTWEEIDIIENGGNYGWNEVEGPACYQSGCDLDAYDAPVFSYRHGDNSPAGCPSFFGCSITGGFVYHGTDVAGLDGLYLYADFVVGRLWGLRYDPASGDASTTLLSTSIPSIASINEGPGGEAFVLSFNGTIYRLEGAVVAAAPEASGASGGLRVVGPNPFRGATTLEVSAADGTPVRVALYDGLGRELAVLHDGPASGDDLRLTVDAAALGLPSGVILAYLDTPTRRSLQRLVVIR